MKRTVPVVLQIAIGGAIGASFFASRAAFAADLLRTPGLTEGPFYPDRLPLDTDNDLIVLNDALTPATGEVTHLTGRVHPGIGAPGHRETELVIRTDEPPQRLHQLAGHRAPGGLHGPARELPAVVGDVQPQAGRVGHVGAVLR